MPEPQVVTIPEGHWLKGETHEGLVTPEAQSALVKYNSREEAILGGLNAQKSLGKPFRLPESLDKLPDDKARGEFQDGVLKLMGAVDKPEALKDINWTAGMPDGSKADEGLQTAFAAFAVENKIPKGIAQKGVEFWNKMVAQLRTANETTQQTAKTENQTKVNEALVNALGSAEKVAEKTELIKRMFKNNLGLTAEEYDQAAEDLVVSGFTGNLTLCKALMAAADKLAGEGSTDAGGGGGGGKPQPKKITEELPKTSKALGW